MFAISIDGPERNAAMVEKLSLPFPYLSDPDRSKAIQPFDVADDKDERNLARPAVILLRPDGTEAFRFVSRDFADRLPEVQLLEKAQSLELPSTIQAAPEIGQGEASPRSLSLAQLKVYFRGARFAAQVMGLRHAHFSDEIKDDSKAYMAEMDRFAEAVDWLLDHQRSEAR